MKTLLFTNGKTMLKTIMKTSIHLPMAAMFLTAVLAGPAAAENQVPFNGSLRGRETRRKSTPCGDHPLVVGAARKCHPSWAIHGDLGSDDRPREQFEESGYHFTAANGDSSLLRLLDRRIDGAIGRCLSCCGSHGPLTGGTGSIRGRQRLPFTVGAW